MTTTIYPTWRSVGLVAAGGPIAVLLSFVGSPGLWIFSLPWIGATVLAVVVDAFMNRSALGQQVRVDAPRTLEAGGSFTLSVSLPAPPSRGVEVALEGDGLLDVQPARLSLSPTEAAASFRLVPRRRGQAVLRALHVRWRGPLGLVWTQRVQALDHAIDIVPNISAVKEEATRLFSRTREMGTAPQNERATSMEFRALREFQRGDDSRSVSWRPSARHRKLLVRETQVERNRSIVFAFDTGRLMCEPLDEGLPRIDHAINAALLMAYVGLKAGDRVGLFAFGAHPSLSCAAAAGVAAFAPLQRLAARIDYTTEETNFTLALSELAGSLNGRALVVVFTEFADSIGAARMIDIVGRLVERHLVLFVTFEDSELETMVRAAPERPADVSRAVVAGGLLRERDAVLRRLRRLGVEILDAPARTVGPSLLRRYLALKREDRL